MSGSTTSEECCNPDCQNFTFDQCDGWKIPTTHSLCESCRKEEFVSAVATMTKALEDFQQASKELNPSWNSYPDDEYVWTGVCEIVAIGNELLKMPPFVTNAGG